MPTLQWVGKDKVVKQFLDAVDGTDHLFGERHRQGAAGTEIILHVHDLVCLKAC